MTDDVNVKMETKWGKLHAALKSHAAGTALVVTAYGAVLISAFGIIAVCLALVLGYEIINFGPLSFGKTRPEMAQPTPENNTRGNIADPKIAEPNPVPKQDKPREDAQRKIVTPLPPIENKGRPLIGLPMSIHPQLERYGEIKKEVPESQGDERDPSEPIPPKAYFKDGRFYIQVPFECERYGNGPMLEACFYSPASPGGRPIAKE